MSEQQEPAWREITNQDELLEFVGPETGPAPPSLALHWVSRL